MDLPPLIAPGEALAALIGATDVAVVGAAAPGERERLGAKPLEYLHKHDFAGRVHVVNPNHEEILGYRCVPTAADLPAGVEVALILVGRDRACEAVRQCGAAGVKLAIVVGGGYADVPGGDRYQAELLAAARESGVRLIGPNCNGVFSAPSRLILSWAPVLDRPLVAGGSVGVVSQSGSFVSSATQRLQRAGLGVRHGFACGNEADLKLEDVVEFMLEDEGTTVVAAYLETSRAPDRLLEVAARAHQLDKPLVVLKVGESDQGAKLSASHTGALVSDYESYVAMFERYGVTQVRSPEEMVEAIALLRGRRPRGSRLAVVSPSGGLNALLADRAADAGLSICDLGKETIDRLEEICQAPVGHPVDLPAFTVGDADAFGGIVEALADDESVDTVVIGWALLPEATSRQWAAALAARLGPVTKPVLAYAPAGELWGSEQADLDAAGVRVCTSMPTMLAAIASASKRANCSPPPKEPLGGRPQAPAEIPPLQGYAALTAALRAAGVPYVGNAVVGDVDEALRAAEDIGFPLAAKICSAQIAHKAAAGGVRLGIADPPALAEALADMVHQVGEHAPGVTIDAFELQRQVPPGVEMFVAAKAGPFGTLLVLGAGGGRVEAERDVSYVLGPVESGDVLEHLRRLGCWPALSDADVAGLVEVVLAVDALMASYRGTLLELELNPVVVHRAGEGVDVVDVLATWDLGAAS